MDAIVAFAEQWIWLVIALPLAGAVFNHFLGSRMPEPLPGVVASLASAAAFTVAAVAAIPWIDGSVHEPVRVSLWSWMPAVGFSSVKASRSCIFT